MVDVNSRIWKEMGHPKVFKMVDLLSNGTNTGKPQSDWIPTLGVVHPNCGIKFDGSD